MKIMIYQTWSLNLTTNSIFIIRPCRRTWPFIQANFIFMDDLYQAWLPLHLLVKLPSSNCGSTLPSRITIWTYLNLFYIRDLFKWIQSIFPFWTLSSFIWTNLMTLPLRELCWCWSAADDNITDDKRHISIIKTQLNICVMWATGVTQK